MAVNTGASWGNGDINSGPSAAPINGLGMVATHIADLGWAYGATQKSTAPYVVSGSLA
jgi:hypothetical protein